MLKIIRKNSTEWQVFKDSEYLGYIAKSNDFRIIYQFFAVGSSHSLPQKWKKLSEVRQFLVDNLPTV